MASLVPANGPRAGERLDLRDELIVGRSPSCDFVLSDDARVSRRHARLSFSEGGWRVADLGSRNGTFLNGERLDADALLAPGDRIQVGGTTFLFDPPLKAAVGEAGGELLKLGPVEEFLPASGGAARIYGAATALLACPSEAAVLRCASEEAMRLLGADLAAALLAGDAGLTTASVVGGAEAKVPRALLRAAVERREAARTAREAVAPLWAGGSAFGLLYAERAEAAFDDAELGLFGALGRMCGGALAGIRERARSPDGNPLVGTSRSLRRVMDQARRAAAGTPVVAFHGEAGTGKALLARFLHARSVRALGPFVEIDCRGPAPAVEEELFGRPGAPGSPPRASALTRADGGTLFLRGVDAMPMELGERLERALRARMAPLPDGGELGCEFQLVFSCRQLPPRLSATGRMDPQLANALDGLEIPVPPLRERKADLPILFDYFAAHAARLLGTKPPELSAEAQRAMADYAWPGNVRELRLCAERLAHVCPGQEVQAAHLPREISSGAPAPSAQKLGELVAEVEKEAIARALRVARGKKILAASLLGISRPTLDKKIALYKLHVR